MFIKSKRILVTMTFGTHHVSTHEVSYMCNCTSCFCSMSSSIVMPAPVRPSVKRGALLRAISGEKVGDLYMLVREATGVFAKDAAGNNIGAPKNLFNLINLTNEGKTRVSRPQRKLVWGHEEVPMDVIEQHFGFQMVPVADNISKIEPLLKGVGMNLHAAKIREEQSALMYRLF